MLYQLLAVGAIPKLVRLSTEDGNDATRKKAIYALSSEIRNYQPGLDEAIKVLPEIVKPDGDVDAGDMEVVDQIIDRLREISKNKTS